MLRRRNQEANNPLTDPFGGRLRITLRNEARKMEILRAAARVFRERGYADAGMREIAAEAGLSTANLYHYFKGKNEILYFCQDRALERMHRATIEARKIPGGRAAQLREILEHHAMCIIGDLDGASAHLETESLPPRLRGPIVYKRDAYEKTVRKLIADGDADGEFECADPAMTTRAVFGALNWTARWYRPEGGRAAADVARSLVDYLMKGLQPDAHAANNTKSKSGRPR
ncbi:MAG: TetR/AcrR family transcriptional regulator [Planctomycetes bacterium]|nr:TetR/AcrR family transcriptional regulator [Planctomycetota bacterium]